MNPFNFEDQSEALEGLREEIHSQLCALLAEKETLEQATFSRRHDALLSEIHKIEQRLADVHLDQQSLQHMEGGE